MLALPLITGQGTSGIGTSISKSISNSQAESESESQLSLFGFCVIVNLLLAVGGQLFFRTLTLSGAALNVGHGTTGIGTSISRSRSISNSQLSLEPLEQLSISRTLIAGFLDADELMQFAYLARTFTLVEPPRITGQGGAGIGTSISMLISNSQLFVFVTVTVPPAELLLSSEHRFCDLVRTVTLPVISGHGIGTSGGGGKGGSQSNIGGGVGGIAQSSTKSKLTHSTNGTSQLLNNAAPDEQYGLDDGAGILSPCSH